MLIDTLNNSARHFGLGERIAVALKFGETSRRAYSTPISAGAASWF